MGVLVVQHVREEGPYAIGEALVAAGLRLRVCRVWAGDPLPESLPEVFAAGRRAFEADPDITGAALHAEVARLAATRGWELGGWHAGHPVGEFPHEKIDGADIESHIAPGNATRLRRPDRAGRDCHWILEIHLIDRERGFGGFHEELLDLG